MKSTAKKKKVLSYGAIKRRFNVAIVMFILVPALILTSFIVYKSTTSKVDRTISTIKEAHIDLLKLHQYEENFLAWKDVKYTREFQTTFQKLMNYMQTLQKDSPLQEEFQLLQEDFKNYNRLFNQLVAEYTTMGLDEKSGLQGSMIDTIHKVEEVAKKLNNTSLHRDILQLRRHEKDFLLRKDAQYVTRFTQACDLLMGSIPSLNIPEETKTSLKQQTEEYKTKFLALVESLRKSGLTHDDGMQKEIHALTIQLEPQFTQLEDEIVSAQNQKSKLLSILVYAAIGFLWVFFIIIYRFVNGSILRPINQLGSSIGALTTGIKENHGDLTQRIPVEKENEIGQLLHNYNDLLDIFHDIFKSIQVSATANARISEKIATGSHKLSSGSNDQAISVTQTASTLEELYSITRTGSQSIEAITTDLDGFTHRVESKKDHIAAVTQTMEEIDESGSQIGEIVRVINDISFRTNLLALNAAVEAARAGEAGRGFAVVAVEVRNLAQKTAESSKNIQDIVTRNVQSTKKGIDLVHQTADFFSSITTDIQNILNRIKENAQGLKEQTTGMEQITMAISNLEAIIATNSKLSNQFSTMSNEIKTNALELEQIVHPFKVDNLTPVKKPKVNRETKEVKERKEMIEVKEKKEPKTDQNIVIPRHSHKPHDDPFFNNVHTSDEFEEF